MANTLCSNTRIPKRNNSELMEFVRLDSHDAKEIIREIQRTNLIEKDTERIFRTISMFMVRNNDLARRFERKRKTLREQGRKPKEVEDRLLFAEESWKDVMQICKSGPNCKKSRNVLGDSQFGLHLTRNLDVLLRYAAYTKGEGLRFLIVFKAMFGKVKSVTPNVANGQDCIEPTPNYDTHISIIKPHPEMGVWHAQDHSMAYLYEYDEETTLPSMSPSQVLPFAVLSLERTTEKIVGPLRTPWPKSRKNRRGSLKMVFKQHLSEDTQLSPMPVNEVTMAISKLKEDRSMASPVEINVESGKRDDRYIDDEQPIPRTQNHLVRQRSALESSENSQNTYRHRRSRSLKGNETTDSSCNEITKQEFDIEPELQYTEYIWDTFDSVEVENTTQETQVKSTETKTVSEKSLIIQRLKEVEKEIQAKSKKLQELRHSRNSSGRSNSWTDEEADVWVDQVDVNSLVYSPIREDFVTQNGDCDESYEPLDLSRRSTFSNRESDQEYKKPSNSTKSNVHTTTKMLDENGVRVSQLDLNKSHEHATTTVVHIPQRNAEGEEETFSESKPKLNLDLLEPTRDTPTPTMDEPQDVFNAEETKTSAATDIVVLHHGNGHVYNAITMSRVARNQSELHSPENAMLISSPRVHTNENATESRTDAPAMLPLSPSKKCSTFYQNYMKKKKQTMGDRFNLCTAVNKCASPIDVSEHNSAACSSSSPHDQRSGDQEPSACKDEFMGKGKDAFGSNPNDDTCKDTPRSVSDLVNNGRVLNPRDPRIHKHVTQDDDSVNESSDEEHQDNDNCMNPVTEKVTPATNLNQPKENDSINGQLTCSDADSGSNNDDSIMECSSCVGCSADEKSDPEPDARTNPDRQKDVVQLDNCSKETPSALPTDVVKTLQELGNAIKVIQQKFVESDDVKSASDVNSQGEEDMEMELKTNTALEQQSISTIVTERPFSQKNCVTLNLSTIMEVNCVSSDKEAFEKMPADSYKSVAESEMTSSAESNGFLSNVNVMKHENSTKVDTYTGVIKTALTEIEMDMSDHRGHDDFIPRNQGFSSYLPNSTCKSTSPTVLKALFQDRVSMIACSSTSEARPDLARNENDGNHETIPGSKDEDYDASQPDVACVKKYSIVPETQSVLEIKLEFKEDSIDETQNAVDTKIAEEPVAHIKLENKGIALDTSDWVLSQQINKTLTEIKNESAAICQPHQVEVVNENRISEKETEKWKLFDHPGDSNSQSRKNSSSRSRSRSKSINISESNTTKSSGQDRHQLRNESPIRDPHFIPFHEKGKILTEYFRNRSRKLGLKWVDRKRSPCNFRARAVQKAKQTLYRNLATRRKWLNNDNETQAKIEKRESIEKELPTWKRGNFQNTHRKPIFRDLKDPGRTFPASNFQDRTASSLTYVKDRQTWHKTGRVHPDDLIIDRHGMIISLDTQPSRPLPGFRSEPRYSRGPRGASVFSRHQNVSRNFRDRREWPERQERHISTLNNSDQCSDSTLSKAMTSLIKRVLFDGPRNDSTTEGKMADMIYEMVKKKVSTPSNDQFLPSRENTSCEGMRGFDNYPPEILSAVRSDRSNSRSDNNTRGTTWMSREVRCRERFTSSHGERSIDRRQSPSSNHDTRSSIDRRQSPSSNHDTRSSIDRRQSPSSNHDTRSSIDRRRSPSSNHDTRDSRAHSDTDNRLNRNFRDEYNRRPGLEYDNRFKGRGRGRWRGRGRGRGNWTGGRSNESFIQNTPFTTFNNRQPFRRERVTYPSRQTNFVSSNTKSESSFPQRNFHNFSDNGSKPYHRQIDKYSDKTSHHRDRRIRESR